jgi:hypothetical protein
MVAMSLHVSPPSERIDIFLMTLRAERHLRRPLLAEVVDRLAEGGFTAAALEARDLLDSLDHDATHAGTDPARFDAAVGRLQRLVRTGRATLV